MSSFTVNTQSEQVFPQGQNDSYMVQNQGPGTVYLDDNSAVNTSSYPLPPTATTVWAAGKALWVLGSVDNTTLVLTPNAVPSDANRLHATITLVNADGTANPTTEYASPILEVSAYSSLDISFSDMTGVTDNPDGTKHYAVTVAHLETNVGGSRVVAYNTYMVGTGYNSGITDLLRVTSPVRSDYAQVFIDADTSGHPAGVKLAYCRIAGRTRPNPEAMEWLGGSNIFPFASGVDNGTDRFASLVGYDRSVSTKIYFANRGPYLTMVVDTKTPVTVAGFLRLREADSNLIIGEQSLPVAGTARYSLKTAVPIAAPYFLTASAYVNGPPNILDIAFLWTDS